MGIVDTIRGVFKTRFLRNILVLSTLVAVLLPVIDGVVIHPIFSNTLIQNSQIEATRVANFLSMDLKAGKGRYHFYERKAD